MFTIKYSYLQIKINFKILYYRGIENFTLYLIETKL